MPRNADRLARLVRGRHGRRPLLDDVRAALDDDLDTPGALAAIDAAAAAGHGVGDAAALLGVDALTGATRSVHRRFVRRNDVSRRSIMAA